MWSKIAEEMGVPWRAVEAMHWQLGEADMARRAGVVPFSLSSVSVDAPSASHQSSPSRGHAHSQSARTIAPFSTPTSVPPASPNAILTAVGGGNSVVEMTSGFNNTPSYTNYKEGPKAK
jgi:hypothetical protein